MSEGMPVNEDVLRVAPCGHRVTPHNLCYVAELFEPNQSSAGTVRASDLSRHVPRRYHA